MAHDPMLDSREGFTAADEAAYHADLDAREDDWQEDFGDFDPRDDGPEFEDDGQPSEYDEWQDYMGGDDWDHGQYDSYDGE